MSASGKIILALSGGVDSAVAALKLRDSGAQVECLHMSNWDDDDGYCDAAADLADARAICDQLGLTLHRVNFQREYHDSVFAEFLSELEAGRTPNPDVLCNREIKFGVMRQYALRLGAARLATGHYARLGRIDGEPVLLKGHDPGKDQSYFLHAVASADLDDVIFPLGELEKADVRRLASEAGLSVAAKRDSTGICFIGERPFGDFLGRFIRPNPGPIVTVEGNEIGRHQGLNFYTLGQRKGLGIGGIEEAGDDPWYVAAKRADSNELVVVQGGDHPALMSDWLETGALHFIGPVPSEWSDQGRLRCRARTRYRQADQTCTLLRTTEGGCIAVFDRPQRAVTPGQYAVFYLDDRCLGGARIERTGKGEILAPAEARVG
jgi:tRNA-specific 2-thiouridylase